MNDFAFGNRLCALRSNAGLTQKEVADRIGISNKAVSKWENGKAKPTTNSLRKLAALFDIPVERLLALREKKECLKSPKLSSPEGRAPENPRP